MLNFEVLIKECSHTDASEHPFLFEVNTELFDTSQLDSLKELSDLHEYRGNQKKNVSGQFVSESSGEAYTSILTLLQTAKIENENALETLTSMFH